MGEYFCKAGKTGQAFLRERVKPVEKVSSSLNEFFIPSTSSGENLAISASG
jgi:hypothetical protein